MIRAAILLASLVCALSMRQKADASAEDTLNVTESEEGQRMETGSWPEELGTLYLYDANIEDKLFVEKYRNRWSANLSGILFKGKTSEKKKVSMHDMEAAFSGETHGHITQFAWAYQDPESEQLPALTENTSELQRFIQTGGFIYFDDKEHIVDVKVVIPIKRKGVEFEVQFGSKQMTEEHTCKYKRDDEWVFVSLDALPGAVAYCWSSAGSGSFNYMMEDGTYIQFPVTGGKRSRWFATAKKWGVVKGPR